MLGFVCFRGGGTVNDVMALSTIYSAVVGGNSGDGGGWVGIYSSKNVYHFNISEEINVKTEKKLVH